MESIMEQIPWVPASAVAIILSVTLISGPLLFPGLDMTQEENTMAAVGTGEITTSQITVPETVTLERGDYGSEGYYVRVPDTIVGVDQVAGRPVLRYRIEIPELGYSRTTAHFVSQGSKGDIYLSIEEDTLDPAKINRSSYAGELQIIASANDTSRVLTRQNITVNVSR